jgi:hypothetical protein
MASHRLTVEVCFAVVTRVRWIFSLCLGLIVVAETSKAALRQPGFPTRRQMIVVVPPLQPPFDPTVKLPPPTAPNLGAGAQGPRALPADVEIEKIPSSAAKPAVTEENVEKRKLKAGRERLNHNALLWQLERAQAGSPTAMRSIGMRYLTGDGLEKNETKAREWLKKGADGGDSAAIKELARLEAKRVEKKIP